MKIALEIKELVKNYDSVKAVRNVSLKVNEGEIFGLLGPNGAGKTSIISIITTLETPTSGQVLVFGDDVGKNPMRTKRSVGVVHQEIVNSGFFDVTEILEFMSGYYGIRNNSERIKYVLQKLGLFEHRAKKVKQLSGGMKRRLMVAKALVHNPKLLLLDEPTAGVDVGLREDLWRFVQELHKEGTTVLLTTHYLAEAQELCQRVGIMDKGQLKCEGPTDEIIKKFSSEKVSLQVRPGKKIIDSRVKEIAPDQYQIIKDSDSNIGEILQGLNLTIEDIVDVRTESGSLEDAFKQVLTTQELQ